MNIHRGETVQFSGMLWQINGMKSKITKTKVEPLKNLSTDSRHMKILQPITALGLREVYPGEIRVEKLEDRLQPRVAFPHRHDFFQITVVTQGKGWHEIDFNQHKIPSSQIFLMKPGQVHSWKLSSKTKGFVIEFTSESLPKDLWRNSNFLSEVFQLSDAVSPNNYDFKRFTTICSKLLYEFELQQNHFESCLQSLLSEFLILYSRNSQDRNSASYPDSEVVSRFRLLVETHFKKEHQVTFYAQSLGLTSKALTMRLSRLINKSPRAIIQERFILEAKRMLAYSGMSVAEIGFELGFEDPNYFTRFFKRFTKMNPSNFRAQTTGR